MTQVIDILDEALESPNGIVVTVTNVEAFKQEVYKTRKGLRDTGDTEYDILSLRTSPTKPETEVWIMKNARGNTT